MRKLYFWILRKCYDGIPSPAECAWALSQHTPTTEILRAMIRRSLGFALEYIAENQEITRERARQYLLKGCRVKKAK